MRNILTTTTILTLGLAGFTYDSAAAAKKASSSTSKAKATVAKAADKAPSKAESRANAERLAAKKAASALTTTQKTKMLALLNEGSADDLVAIHGIGKTRAAALSEARPYKSVDQLVDVKGVGTAVYSDLIAHAKSLTARRSSGSSKGSSPKSKSATKKTSSSKTSTGYRPGPCIRRA